MSRLNKTESAVFDYTLGLFVLDSVRVVELSISFLVLLDGVRVLARFICFHEQTQ